MAFNPSIPRFFIALLPPQPLQEMAQKVIQELGDRYQTRTAKAPPHVTLQPPFEWPIHRLAELEHCLSALAQREPLIPVQLSGFAAFAPRVLYINVLKTPELLALQATVTVELEQHLGIVDPKSKHRPFTPHMTVASRHIDRPTFNHAWADLNNRQLEADFVGDRLTLLIHDGQQWQIQSEFHFQPLTRDEI